MAVAALLITLTLTTSGCGRMGYLAMRTAITVATVATIVHWHDSHFHHHHCGHEYVYVEDRPVYHYQGRWEYYDQESGHWYQYEELPR